MHVYNSMDESSNELIALGRLSLCGGCEKTTVQYKEPSTELSHVTYYTYGPGFKASLRHQLAVPWRKDSSLPELQDGYHVHIPLIIFRHGHSKTEGEVCWHICVDRVRHCCSKSEKSSLMHSFAA
jgi:hypothetical protein